MALNLDKFLAVVEEVKKLPEVGDPIIRHAEIVQAEAKRLLGSYLLLEAAFDDLTSEIHELWSPEERNGTYF